MLARTNNCYRHEENDECSGNLMTISGPHRKKKVEDSHLAVSTKSKVASDWDFDCRSIEADVPWRRQCGSSTARWFADWLQPGREFLVAGPKWIWQEDLREDLPVGTEDEAEFIGQRGLDTLFWRMAIVRPKIHIPKGKVVGKNSWTNGHKGRRKIPGDACDYCVYDGDDGGKRLVN